MEISINPVDSHRTNYGRIENVVDLSRTRELLREFGNYVEAPTNLLGNEGGFFGLVWIY